MTVTRTLPEALWKRYLANEHPAISEPEEVTQEHILQFKASIPDQDFTLNDDGSLEYRIKVSPVRRVLPVRWSRPLRTRSLGRRITTNHRSTPSKTAAPFRLMKSKTLRDIAETCTVEINWQDGDVAVIDNTRVMHGRRAIKDQDRQLFIGMGRL